MKSGNNFSIWHLLTHTIQHTHFKHTCSQYHDHSSHTALHTIIHSCTKSYNLIVRQNDLCILHSQYIRHLLSILNLHTTNVLQQSIQNYSHAKISRPNNIPYGHLLHPQHYQKITNNTKHSTTQLTPI